MRYLGSSLLRIASLLLAYSNNQSGQGSQCRLPKFSHLHHQGPGSAGCSLSTPMSLFLPVITHVSYSFASFSSGLDLPTAGPGTQQISRMAATASCQVVAACFLAEWLWLRAEHSPRTAQPMCFSTATECSRPINAATLSLCADHSTIKATRSLLGHGRLAGTCAMEERCP